MSCNKYSHSWKLSRTSFVKPIRCHAAHRLQTTSNWFAAQNGIHNFSTNCITEIKVPFTFSQKLVFVSLLRKILTPCKNSHYSVDESGWCYFRWVCSLCAACKATMEQHPRSETWNSLKGDVVKIGARSLCGSAVGTALGHSDLLCFSRQRNTHQSEDWPVIDLCCVVGLCQ